jgi:hypothetical protein
MGVELRIELAAGVVVIHGYDQVAGGAVLIGSVLPHARRGMRFQFLQGFRHGFLVGFFQPSIAPEFGHDRNRFGSGNREVVQIAAPALGGAIGSHAVGALALSQKLAGMRIETLPDRFEVSGFDGTRKAKQRRPAALPFSDDSLPFGIVIAMFQMSGRVPLTVRHGADRQHN